MPLIKKILPGLVICLSMAACDQSGDNEKQAGQDPTSTNAAGTPLIIPDITSQAPSTNLQDIWVLDSINKAPDSNQFTRGTPYLDINPDKKTITGHTGCNALNGKLTVEGEKIIFDSLFVLKEVCKDKGFEKNCLLGSEAAVRLIK